MKRTSADSNPLIPDHFPVVEICGAEESDILGLAASLIPHLLSRNLRIAVVFDTSIDGSAVRKRTQFVIGYAPGLSEKRCVHSFFHRGDKRDLLFLIAENIYYYDLILLVGKGKTPAKKIWFLPDNGSQIPPWVQSIERTFSIKDKVSLVADFLFAWLDRIWLRTPLWGCVLIGGKSSRMGSPKHLLRDEQDNTWLERIVTVMSRVTSRIVLAGKGEVPEGLHHLPRLPDASDMAGPLAGILAVMRWQPAVSWLLAACDMPNVNKEALQWLLEQRRAGVWGAIPIQPEGEKRQPLLAYYDFRSASLFETLYRSGSLRVSNLADETKVEVPPIPQYIQAAWSNVNTPGELKQLKLGSDLGGNSTGGVDNT